jgi:hypothetical protein
MKKHQDRRLDQMEESVQRICTKIDNLIVSMEQQSRKLSNSTIVPMDSCPWPRKLSNSTKGELPNF